jgi:hypothetical protein
MSMKISVNQAKVEVDDTFEQLINDINVKVERFFAENSASIRPYNNPPDPLFVRINEWREECIKEIRECKYYNLSLIDIKTAQLPLKQRIKRFCFLASYMDTVFKSANQFSYTLFSTDKYLTKGEITCFEALLKFMPGAEHQKATNKFETNPGEKNRNQHIKSVGDLFAGFGKVNQVSASTFYKY